MAVVVVVDPSSLLAVVSAVATAGVSNENLKSGDPLNWNPPDDDAAAAASVGLSVVVVVGAPNENGIEVVVVVVVVEASDDPHVNPLAGASEVVAPSSVVGVVVDPNENGITGDASGLDVSAEEVT